jgi:hypothetical protein
MFPLTPPVIVPDFPSRIPSRVTTGKQGKHQKGNKLHNVSLQFSPETPLPPLLKMNLANVMSNNTSLNCNTHQIPLWRSLPLPQLRALASSSPSQTNVVPTANTRARSNAGSNVSTSRKRWVSVDVRGNSRKSKLEICQIDNYLMTYQVAFIRPSST